jgi:ribosomal protein S18 acetylase RimI-like enzyme
MQYRSFLNTDPPLIVDIWRRQHPFRSQVSAVTRTILDHHIFSKPYFDFDGFILAIDDESPEGPTPVGFVHAAFDANDDLSDLNKKVGIVCQLKVIPGERSEEVADKLLQKAIEYLVANGCEEVYCGSRFPNAPFYLGLYGGSQLPGFLVDDEQAIAAVKRNGFVENDRIVVMERRLAGFRTIVDREQMALRRRFQINAAADPLETSWWESCTVGMSERDRFSVYDKSSQNVCGSVKFWDIQPLANHWGVLARGLYGLKVPEEHRRGGIATFLVGESLRHLMQQGIGVVEAQTRESDQPAIGVFKKLGFEQVTEGILMSKRLD